MPSGFFPCRPAGRRARRRVRRRAAGGAGCRGSPRSGWGWSRAGRPPRRGRTPRPGGLLVGLELLDDVLRHLRREDRAVGLDFREARLRLGQQRLLRVDVAVVGDAVQRVVDVADGGSRGTGAGAALGDRHDDRVVLGVRREPGRGLLAVDLGGTGLGVHRDLVLRPADLGEPPGGGAAAGDAGEGLVHLGQRGLAYGQLAVGRGLDLADGLAVGADDGLADARVVEGAAVGDGRVDGGHLDGGDEGVALADGVVDGVTGAHLVAAVAVLVRDLLDVGAVLLAGLAPGVLVGLPVVLLPLAVGDAAGDLVGEVDAGLGAEAELVGGLVEVVVGVLGVHPAVLLPLLVGQAVEDGVAGELQGAADGDHALVGRLEVLEDLAADVVGAGAVVVAVEVVAGLDRSGRGDDLEDGAGGRLALGGAVEQRVVGVLAGELLVVLGGDAADPGVGVVVGVGGHGDYAAGLGLHHHDRSGVGLVGPVGVAVHLLAGGLHRLVQLVLGDPLDAGVDAGDEVGAGVPGSDSASPMTRPRLSTS